MRIPMRRWTGALALAVLWVLLFGEVSVGNVVAGVVVGAVIVRTFPHRPSAVRHRIAPWGLVRLLARLVVDLVVSSTQVAVAVVRPSPARLRTAVVRVPLTSGSDLVHTIVADLITLTPGTLTLDVRHDPERCFVHALGADPDAIRASVQDLERRVLRAVVPEPAGPAPDREADS